MSGRLLIVDSVSTNRIVLRVKLLAAKYDVEAVSDCTAAYASVQKRCPDMILINLTDNFSDGHAFCTHLRAQQATRNVPIISVGGQDTSAARFMALDAGADDVLPRPVCDTLLLARVRNLLRRGNRARELDLRSETLRMMGLDETRSPRIAPACVTLLSDHALAAATFQRSCRPGWGSGCGSWTATVPFPTNPVWQRMFSSSTQGAAGPTGTTCSACWLICAPAIRQDMQHN
ncbi:two-component system response regulator [Loktanella sp. 3ANDIMAR09]|uniref:response regulator n=1 Tax=Loktanella sp. 3ANDIMAR09 TaxID=1225657 RepID=UPI00155EED47|nr:response regulator [Loktanella sp. 3ANDIMAR09]